MCSQVARTINNMQQQIQQHQRQLAQALLMKQQQQQPPASHLGLHPSAGKSALDTFPAHHQASSLSVSDLQTTEPQSSPNSFSPYPICELPALSVISFFLLKTSEDPNILLNIVPTVLVNLELPQNCAQTSCTSILNIFVLVVSKMYHQLDTDIDQLVCEQIFFCLIFSFQ